MTNTALVLGATGVAGRALVAELERAGDWDIIGVSRRAPDFSTSARFVSADLFDPASCREILGSLKSVSHVFWAAYANRPTFEETREPNARMFRNAISAIESTGQIKHICICQGTKYYGQHLGPFKTPARETDPRISIPHFYYEQEDFILNLQQGKSWTWSAARPHVICGYARGNPLNVVSVLAVYATLRKELGLPLTFPGKPAAFTSLYQATHAPLLGRAMIWMSTTPSCANLAFNITNGDYFRYQNMWPIFASYFGMEAGGVETRDLEVEMADRTALWEEIVSKYGLKTYPFATVADWHFANYAFSNDWDVMSDTLRCREHGFLEFIRSDDMFLHEFDVLKREGIIPP
jgi:nucleoside-diphosphate-sugar epimerase